MNASVIYRSYDDAAFVLQRGSRESLFSEGGASRIVPFLLSDPNFQPTMSLFPEFPAQYWGDISEDCELLRQEIAHFLSGDTASQSRKEGFVTEDMEESAMKRLSKYAVSHWQLTSANIELTHQCNFRCRMCYLADYRHGGIGISDLEKIGVALREEGVMFTSFTGGEVFLRPDAIDILTLFSELGFALELKTNGSLLDPDKISALAKLFVFDVQVSIYETSEGPSELTRRTYPFGRIADNIRHLHASGLPITLSVLVGKHNVDALESIHHALKEIADVPVSYTPYITPRRSGVDEGISFRLSAEEMQKKFLPFLRRIDGLAPLQKYRDCDTCINTCFAGRDQVAIDPMGNVYPCLDLPEIIGNARKGDVRKILSAESRKKTMSKFLMKDMAQCLSCDLREYCDSCVGIAMVENGDHTRPARHKCDVVRFYAVSQI